MHSIAYALMLDAGKHVLEFGAFRPPCYSVSAKVSQNQELTEDGSMKNPRRRYKGRPHLGPAHVREGVALVHRGRSYDGAGLDSNQLAKLTVDLLTGQLEGRVFNRL